MNNKPGYQTTEFWVTLATTLGSLIVSLISSDHATEFAGWSNHAAGWIGAASAIAAGLSAGLYVISRAIAKR